MQLFQILITLSVVVLSALASPTVDTSTKTASFVKNSPGDESVSNLALGSLNTRDERASKP